MILKWSLLLSFIVLLVLLPSCRGNNKNSNGEQYLEKKVNQLRSSNTSSRRLSECPIVQNVQLCQDMKQYVLPTQQQQYDCYNFCDSTLISTCEFTDTVNDCNVSCTDDGTSSGVFGCSEILFNPECADVVAVTATTTSGTDNANGDNNNVWTFAVTVSSQETGWDKYADEYQVRTIDGNVILGTRTLAHPHVQEQPFTRTLSNVQIPNNIQNVIVAARDSIFGYCGEEYTYTLPIITTPTTSPTTEPSSLPTISPSTTPTVNTGTTTNTTSVPVATPITVTFTLTPQAATASTPTIAPSSPPTVMLSNEPTTMNTPPTSAPVISATPTTMSYSSSPPTTMIISTTAPSQSPTTMSPNTAPETPTSISTSQILSTESSSSISNNYCYVTTMWTTASLSFLSFLLF